MLPQTITAAEAASMCQCSAWTIQQAARRGELPAYKHCRPHRFIVDDVEEWFRRQKKNGYKQRRIK